MKKVTNIGLMLILGLVGLFSYLVAGVQDTISGYLLDASKQVVDGATVYSFRLVFMVWIGALVLSTLLAASLWLFTRRTAEPKS